MKASWFRARVLYGEETPSERVRIEDGETNTQLSGIIILGGAICVWTFFPCGNSRGRATPQFDLDPQKSLVILENRQVPYL